MAAFASIGSVVVNGCSAGLARLPDADPASPALVLTNGHCLDLRSIDRSRSAYLYPGEFLHDRSETSLIENIIVTMQTPARPKSLRVRRVIFSTMTTTDVSILELEESLQTLERDHGVNAFILDLEDHRASGQADVIASYFNRRFSCPLEGQVHLNEGPYRTTEGVRLGMGCSIYPGVSGSPIIRAGSNHMIGLANTHFSGSGQDCSLNNPCEVDNQGRRRSAEIGRSYGVALSNLKGCTHGGEFDFTRSTCTYREAVSR